LGATAVEVSWLSTAYFATALSAVVLITKLRLQVGIERFATCSIAGFLAVSLGYSLAPSLATAIAARAFLGLTAAPLITLAVLYIMEAMPPALMPVGAVLGFGTVQLGPRSAASSRSRSSMRHRARVCPCSTLRSPSSAWRLSAPSRCAGGCASRCSTPGTCSRSGSMPRAPLLFASS
jgi:hypothetical protein